MQLYVFLFLCKNAPDEEIPAITGVAFSPDGSTAYAAAGNQLWQCDALSGQNLVKSLRCDTVLASLSINTEGTLIATACDRDVLIWNHLLSVVSKYSHLSKVTSVSFNPVSGEVASGSRTELIVASSGSLLSRSVSTTRRKAASPISCLCWAADGETLAVGHINGVISIHDHSGAEVSRYKCQGPVSAITAVPPALCAGESVFCACAWDRALHFFSGHSGDSVSPPGRVHGLIDKREPQGKVDDDIQLPGVIKMDFLPTLVAYSSVGHLYVGGTNNQIGLFAGLTDFIPIVTTNSWPRALSFQAKPNSELVRAMQHNEQSAAQAHQFFVYGSQGGQFRGVEATPSVIHALYADKYVWRAGLTAIGILSLSGSSRRQEIVELGRYVVRVAIYHNRVAVLLQDSILVLSQRHGEFNILARIPGAGSCSLLCVTADNVFVCRKNRITSYNIQDGSQAAQWAFAASISYLLIVGGLRGHEALLVGTQSGGIYRVFVDRPLSTQLYSHTSGIRCIDLSPDRGMLAFVDSANVAYGFSVMDTSRPLFRIEKAVAAAFSSSINGVCVVTGPQSLWVVVSRMGGMDDSREQPSQYTPGSTVTLNHATLVHEQPSSGFVVGVTGSRAFCFQNQQMRVADIPLGPVLRYFVDSGALEQALLVAYLGISSSEWRLLAAAALRSLNFPIARSAYIHLHDLDSLTLVERLETMLLQARDHGADEETRARARATSLATAELSVQENRFPEAAVAFVLADEPQRAAELVFYTPSSQLEQLRKAIADAGASACLPELTLRQARLLENSGDYQAAAAAYQSVGRYMHAVTILAEQHLYQDLLDLVAHIPSDNQPALRAAAEAFTSAGRNSDAAYVWRAAGDMAELARSLCASGDYTEALRISEDHPEAATTTYPLYARYLVGQGDLIRAQEWFMRASCREQAVSVLSDILRACIARRLWKQASHAAALLMEAAEDAPRYHRMALVYQAYSIIDQYIRLPFSQASPAHLVGAAAVVLDGRPELGVSVDAAAFVAARQALSLGDGPTARRAAGLLTPHSTALIGRSPISVYSLQLSARAAGDDLSEQAQICRGVCAACGEILPPLASACASCGVRVIRSPLSWAVLPLYSMNLPQQMRAHPQAVRQLVDAVPTGDPAAANSLPERLRDTDSSRLLTATHNGLIDVYKLSDFADQTGVAQCQHCMTFFSSFDFSLLSLGAGLSHGQCCICGANLNDH